MPKIDSSLVAQMKAYYPSKTIAIDPSHGSINVNTSKIITTVPNPIVPDRWTHGELDMFHLLTPALQAVILADLENVAANM